jgi:hypothetical protein
VEASLASGDDAIALPTFTAHIVTGMGKKRVRIFKDGGCQRSFITSSLAEKLDLPVVASNVSFQIHGFNSNRTIHTKIVRLSLMINKQIFKLDVICLEKINTQFSVNGISSAAAAFQSAGYRLADEAFVNANSTKVANLDLILGTDADYMLPMTYISFGDKSQKASFISSPIGVIFSGSIKALINNISRLPPCSTNSGWATRPTNLRRPMPSLAPPTHREGEGDVKPNLGITSFACACSHAAINDNFTFDNAPADEEPSYSESDQALINHVLKNVERDHDGRLIIPLTWNNQNSHLLAKNYHLSLSILQSTKTKLRNDPNKLRLYNDVINEQRSLGIIEKVEDLPQFMELHPECSFLPHSAVYRMNHESTKCRVVFLSNLCEKKNNGISHNQAMLPGPSLNHKITNALMLLRFDSLLMVFDLKKAFLTIKLPEHDQNRLMFLWFKDVEKGDFTVVGYRNLRLSFGLRCSPALLMLALYKILVLDKSGDEKLDRLKSSLYNTIYMDNASYSCNSHDELIYAYNSLETIFSPYKFQLQQFSTNSEVLQLQLTASAEETAPNETKFFGMSWNRCTDELIPNQITLNLEASTKRAILSTINAIYDIYNLYAPVLLRARIFMQKLLCDKSLHWDSPLPESLLCEWQRIAKQANDCPRVSMARSVGPRAGRFSLIAFTDASRDATGVVIYIKDMTSNRVSFLLAKNRLVSTNCRKTIPTLELDAIRLGVETLVDTRRALAGETVAEPINVENLYLFSDSMVSLHWIHSFAVKFAKVQGLSIFVRNTLRSIEEFCRNCPITFSHISGELNPADNLTRPRSHRVLMKTNYYQGPSFLSGSNLAISDLTILLPNPLCRPVDEVTPNETTFHVAANSVQCPPDKPSHLIPLDKFSNLRKLVNVYKLVLQFVDKLKLRKAKVQVGKSNYYVAAFNSIIAVEQKLQFQQELAYLESKNKGVREMPQLVAQLNLYKCKDGLLRMRSKFGNSTTSNCRLILLPKTSHLTTLIIRGVHEQLCHSGIYCVLKELRKQFWVPQCFSVVKRVLRQCIPCRKIHERPITLNQSPYRDFRVDPPQIPFSSVFIDYIGPFSVKYGGTKGKAWLFIITCLWSRAVNMKVCHTATTDDFLRAIQLHVFEYGLFQSCFSDLGTQLQAGANLISTFLSDHDTQQFFSSNGIRPVQFQHYPKGNSSLGSMVEVCVKQVKYLIYKSIRNVVLNISEFEFLIAKVISLINKRPVAFKEVLRSLPREDVPSPITPEILLRGYETLALNVVPNLQPVQNDDYVPGSHQSNIKPNYERLRKVRERFIDLYHSEFLTTLVSQAVDKPDRYRPVLHKDLKPGDVVLLTDKNTKRYHFPMGRVHTVERNSLGEITAARVFKGGTREMVYRHATSLIRLISCDNLLPDATAVPPSVEPRRQPTRQAANLCRDRIKLLTKNELV